MEFYDRGMDALEEGVSVDALSEMKILEKISRMSNIQSEKWEEKYGDIEMQMNKEFDDLVEG